MNTFGGQVGNAIGLAITVLIFAALVNVNGLIANIHTLFGGCR